MDASSRVVVTGMGALTPIGLSVDAFWEGLLAGTSGAAPIASFDASDLKTTFACELKGFDPEDYLDRKEARRMDPFCQYAIVASDMALADAGLDTGTLPQDVKDRVAVILGTGIGGMKVFQEQAQNFIEHGERRVSPFFIPMLIPDIASGHVAIRHGFRGPNHAVISACATGNDTIGAAFRLLRCGEADMAVCGGAEAGVTPLSIAGFGSLRALSRRNDDPAHASRPFDAQRDGFVMGDGAGVLVLETLEHAQRRGARIHAELAGIGASADAYHLTAPDPDGGGVCLALQRVLKQAGLQPTDVDYINTHGTSTPLGDVAETKAVKAVFGDHAYDLNLSSTKSLIGHLLGAAGAVESIATILAITHDTAPPTINFEEADPACDLNYTFNEPQARRIDVALSNAFGFGGHNTSVAFRTFDVACSTFAQGGRRREAWQGATQVEMAQASASPPRRALHTPPSLPHEKRAPATS
jgi:3-oxoacyl-[acyl-carrier-protein] synthase II